MSFIDRQIEELSKGRGKHAAINSAHEGYAVILGELCEFFEEARKDRVGFIDRGRMLAELVQIAAMAQRTAEDLELIPRGMAHSCEWER